MTIDTPLTVASPSIVKPGTSASERKRRLTNAGIMLPVVVIMALSFGWPLLTVLLRSLNKDGLAKFGVPYLGHYEALLHDSLLRQIAEQTVWLAFLATIVTTVVAFPLAYLISRVGRRLGVVLLAFVLLPFWVSILVRLFAFTAILGRQGVVNDFLGQFGVGPWSLLFNTRATVIGMVAYLLPYLVLILYAAMSSVDMSLVTAAKTLGASSGQAFRHIYFPQIRGSLVSGCLLVFVLSLGFFLTPALLGGPTNLTLPVYIQQQITIFDWGRASAAGVALLVVSLVGYAIAMKISGISVIAPGGRPVNRGTVAREPLGWGFSTVGAWIVSAAGLLLLVGPLLIIIPSAFSASNDIKFPPQGFTLDWFHEVLTDPLWTDAIFKSFRVGIATAIVATLLGLASARAFSKVTSSWVRLTIQTVAFAPLIVPVILLAVGIYDVQLRLGWVGTDYGLVLAHAVLAFPFAFLVISNSMGRLDRSLEEAAWSMGVTKIRTFWTIVVPNLAPALVGALVISFMTSWDEAIVALFQTELTKTLPVTIYSFIKSGVTPAVAAVAVLLIVPILLAMIAYVANDIRRTGRAESRAS